MLETTGDILNWLAAGVLFPLMFLPLGFYFSQKRTLTFWLVITALTTIAGAAFIYIVPSLNISATSTMLSTFIAVLSVTSVLAGFGDIKKFQSKAASLFGAITRTAGRTVMWLLLVMALVQFAVVLLRYVFGVNWIFMQESVTYMHGIIFLVAAGYALITDDHVRVDIFYREAPPKRKALIDLLGTYLFLFPICLLILWTASPYVARSWLVMEGSADTSGIQGVFLLKSLIPLFAVLFAMAGFVTAHRAVEILKGRGN